MFIEPAYAQAAGGAGGGDMFVSLMPLVLIFVVFYFLLIRPQQSRAKQHKQMIDNVKRGDQVLTGGGIIGKVTRVEAGESTLVVEIAQNVTVKVARTTISEVLTKPLPATSNDNRTVKTGTGGGGGGLSASIAKFFKR